ncbi:hypothetical protein CK623_06240 [Vandammella animalimorsus]|uniref:Uncharacterized protein n=1 Tax=Vandammella animalimorsus TaxID=2029117 RepID=A0A2A2AF36_9BURK|nr:hypothetical protein [Vandammella animalimorsus]PAT36406.1 hypothetical protein CK625_11520 [Vandammella animalimorsus]PAT40284.1 hypothetical protein CK623_06240 [Vandammella animalimorsus]
MRANPTAGASRAQTSRPTRHTLPAASLPVRNPYARALAAKASTGAGGKHMRSQGAQRRAERMALQRSIRTRDWASAE